MSNHLGVESPFKGLLGTPSTSPGRVSALLFVVGLSVMLLTSTVLESNSLTVGNLNVVGMVGFVVFLVALVTGAMALMRRGERSWAVWLSTGFPAIVLGFEIFSLLIPGG